MAQFKSVKEELSALERLRQVKLEYVDCLKKLLDEADWLLHSGDPENVSIAKLILAQTDKDLKELQ